MIEENRSALIMVLARHCLILEAIINCQKVFCRYDDLTLKNLRRWVKWCLAVSSTCVVVKLMFCQLGVLPI